MNAPIPAQALHDLGLLEHERYPCAVGYRVRAGCRSWKLKVLRDRIRPTTPHDVINGSLGVKTKNLGEETTRHCGKDLQVLCPLRRLLNR